MMLKIKKIFNRKIKNEILREIEIERLAAEKLTAWVQLLFSIFLGLVWYLAPKAYAQNKVSAEVVPYFFMVYAPILILRMLWAYKKRITKIKSLFFITLDISFVLLLIWFFHIQYQQTTAFYLKLPLFGYLFVILSMRALTLNVVNVVSTTLLALTGWSALVFIAINDSANLRTHDFIEYTVTQKILLGAEIEKIIYFVTVSVILSIAVYRQSRLQEKTVEASLKAETFSKFFSPEVSELIINSGQELKVGEGQKRTASVLMVDLRGFSLMSQQMSAGEVMMLLSEYYSRVVPIVFRNRGCIDKFMGDGILAHFGAANDSLTYAKDCLNSVYEINTEIDNWNRERSLQGKSKIVVNSASSTGDIVFGAAGGAGRLEYTIIGTPVNLTAKLEKYNKEIGATSVTTQLTLDKALEYGFSHKVSRKFKTNEISGVSGEQEIAVLI